MQVIAEAVYKGKQFVEGCEKLIEKKVRQIEEHYNITIDEVSDGRINQQTIWASASNTELIEKLDKLEMYKPIKFLANVSFYEGKPTKVTILDLLENAEDLTMVTTLFNKQEVKSKAEREMKKKEQK